MAGTALQQLGRPPQHPPTGEVEAEVEATGLHADGLAPGCNGCPVLLEVVEAVVERGIPRTRFAIAEVSADSYLYVHFVPPLSHHPVVAAI